MRKFKGGRTTHTATIVIESMTIKLLAAGCEFDAVNASQFEVDAEFTYLPEQAPILTGPWEDADPGSPAEIEIIYLRAEADITFDCDDSMPVTYSMLAPGDVECHEPGITLTIKCGRDLRPLFSLAELDAIEEQLLEQAMEGNTDD